MPAYMRQRDSHCGPVASYNTMVWGKFPVNEQLFLDLCEEMRSDPILGADDIYNVVCVLKKRTRPHLAITEMANPSVENIERHVRAGGAVLLYVGWRDPLLNTSDGHVSLIPNVSRRGNFFYAVNYCSDRSRATQRIPRSTLLRDVYGRKRDKWNIIYAWHLTRVSKPNLMRRFKNFLYSY